MENQQCVSSCSAQPRCCASSRSDSREDGRIREGSWGIGRGQPHVVFNFTITYGKIIAIDILADPERLNELDLTVLK